MRSLLRLGLMTDTTTPLLVKMLRPVFATREHDMRCTLTWVGWRKITVHCGRTDELPSCAMLVEPISQKQPVVMICRVKGGLKGLANPVIEPEGQAANADDGIDERLKEAYWGDYHGNGR